MNVGRGGERDDAVGLACLSIVCVQVCARVDAHIRCARVHAHICLHVNERVRRWKIVHGHVREKIPCSLRTSVFANVVPYTMRTRALSCKTRRMPAQEPSSSLLCWHAPCLTGARVRGRERQSETPRCRDRVAEMHRGGGGGGDGIERDYREMRKRLEREREKERLQLRQKVVIRKTAETETQRGAGAMAEKETDAETGWRQQGRTPAAMSTPSR